MVDPAITFGAAIDAVMGILLCYSWIDSGRYVYDVLITSGASAKTRVVEGIVTINPRVTQ